eukprot:gi/632971838/ref/XP_007902367.1/ PREDICTED: zinc-binding protein A33-like [Callorhinchus milii]
MEEVFRSQAEEETNIIKLKKIAESLGQNIAAEFSTMHRFLDDEEEAMKGKLEQEVEKMARQLRDNLDKMAIKRVSIERTILEIQQRLNVQETAFLACTLQSIFGYPPNVKRLFKSKFAVDVFFNPNTAHPELLLSDDLTSVRLSDTWQDLPDNAERFDDCVSVLASQGFDSGRHFWQVEVGRKTMWDVGLARESVNRKGNIILSPEDGFWTIWLRNGNEYEALSTPSALLSLRAKPKMIGVFLDYERGHVSFYNADDMSVLYTFTNKFTEKLFPYFSPGESDGGKNAEPLKLCAVQL